MWKNFLFASAMIAALLIACSDDAAIGPNGADDADAAAAGDDDGGDAPDATTDASDASAKKDAAKKDAAVTTGSCGGMPDDTMCLDDAGFDGICCAGECVSAFDKAHCHACSAKCDEAAGEACGLSGCLGKTCKPGRTECYTAAGGIGGCCDGTAACSDLQTDPKNCGGCGVTCAATEQCASGHCILSDCSGAPGGATCLGGGGTFYGSCCGGACVNTDVSATSCSRCGYGCPDGATCSGGQCKNAGGGSAYCGMTGMTCPSGTSCDRPSGRCVQDTCNGTTEEGFGCRLAGDAAGACCGGTCKDLSFDVKNCGACGRTCKSGEWCNHGYCEAEVTCDATNSDLTCNLASGRAGVCCEGSCVDPHSADNCGRCGAACPPGATCNSSGGCVNATGGSAYCLKSSDCSGGRICQAGRCVKSTCAPGASGAACAFGATRRGDLGTCCNGECVDLGQDKDSCGQCGKVCPTGLCVGGQCMPSAGASCPFGGCSNGFSCVEGNCVPTACAIGPMSGFCPGPSGDLGACCDQFFSATCKSIKSDNDNCGGCGVRCPSGQTCQNGVCSGASGLCQDGHEGGFCDLGTSEAKLCCGGACADTRSDVKNCGRCGQSCLFDESCVSGRCALVSCVGASDGRSCNTGSGNGVCCHDKCVDTTSDEANCGQCGKGCAVGAECRASRCALPACAAGKNAGAPCFLSGGSLVGRCCGGTSCIDISHDATNCLGCGLTCAPGQTCQDGCK